MTQDEFNDLVGSCLDSVSEWSGDDVEPGDIADCVNRVLSEKLSGKFFLLAAYSDIDVDPGFDVTPWESGAYPNPNLPNFQFLQWQDTITDTPFTLMNLTLVLPA